ncbi:carboxymuconolactone decarboxylase family protein [Methanoplanus endosymbiosus]|uniref:Carboxymuconolactone decarboxylase family protein n=1 Tax=Methanoplanus endosymbiosus TaxID=33865 RepID=A0A9E7TM73_9EURY|nr:carboxymuconolactone decarboxylase family protein [Methanoplanus endosymbiosus]UUX93031.1 carboxymuconolactone decarboxylase family protein [Methanoplanus endosymbiosus]
MNDKSKKAIEEFLSSRDDISAEILEESKEFFGRVPFILDILKERPKSFVFNTLGDFETLRPKSLDDATAELICVASATALGATACLKVHIGAALKAGATMDQVLDAIMIPAALGRTSILAPSLRVFKECRDNEMYE